MAPRWAAQCYQVLSRPWEITVKDVEIDLIEFRNNESMQYVRRLQVTRFRFRNGKKLNEDDS